MKLTVFLSGQYTFGNRGCEAIVRSTVGLLRKQFSDIEFLVPSRNIARDRDQWPDAAELGVRFVPAYYPSYARCWIHAHRLPVPLPKRGSWPFPVSRQARTDIERADLVLSVGGDNYSLDYNLPLLQLGLDQAAMKMGKPVVLWGASVGPFEAQPDFVPVIRQHLEKMRLITARESVTFNYLRSLGLSNVISVADPAFTLAAQEVDVTAFWPREGDSGVLGLNVSSLIERYRAVKGRGHRIVDEVADFVRRTVADAGCSVLLVPHVTPLDGASKDNDARYLAELMSIVGNMDGYVSLMDSRLNAAQIKYVTAKCRFFVGARTHATIAALSSGVPTISIAYSVKAKGINQDLFGHTDYVLDTPAVATQSLCDSLRRLIADEAAIRACLTERIPLWQSRAEEGAKQVAEMLR